MECIRVSMEELQSENAGSGKPNVDKSAEGSF